MATKVIGTGGDFTTTTAWLSYLNALGTLTAPEVAQFKNTGTSWGDKLIISGITTSATNTLTLQAFPGDENKGVVGQGVTFAGNSGGSWGVFVLENGCQHVIIQDLAFTGGASETVWITSGTMTMAGDSFVTMNRCLVSGLSLVNGSTNVFSTITVNNCISYDTAGTNTPIQGYSTHTGNTFANYCTFIKNHPYSATTNPTGCRYTIATNCVVMNFGGSGGWSDFLNMNASSDYCASHDTTAPGTHSIHSLTDSAQFTGVGDGSWDFTPLATGSLVGAGTPISGITTDIAGNTRDATAPTIGAFEFVSSGGGTGLAVDSQEASNTAHVSSSSPLTWSFTNTAGNLLIVGVVVCAVDTPVITAVTYGGTAMTQVTDSDYSYGSSPSHTQIGALYYLLDPPTGSNTVSVTVSGTFDGAAGADILGGAISFSGAGSVGTAVASGTTTGASTASVTVTGTTSGSQIVSIAQCGSEITSFNSPTTESALLNNSENNGGDNFALGVQSTTGGDVDASYSFMFSDQHGLSAVEIFASSGSTPLTQLLITMFGW